MLEITLAVVRQYIGQPLPSELDSSLGVFQTFAKKILFRLKRPSFSPKSDTLAVPRLLQTIEKLGATITSHHTSTLDRLQQILHDIHTTFAAPTRPQSAALSILAIPTSTILESVPETIVRVSYSEHITQATTSSETISVTDADPPAESTYVQHHTVVASPPMSERSSTPTDDDLSPVYGTPESGAGVLSDVSTELSVHIEVEPPSDSESEPSTPGTGDVVLLSPNRPPPPLPIAPIIVRPVTPETAIPSLAAFELLQRPSSSHTRTTVRTATFNRYPNPGPQPGQTSRTGVDTSIGERTAFTSPQRSLPQLPPGFVPLSYTNGTSGAYSPGARVYRQHNSGESDIDSDDHPLSLSYPPHTRRSITPLSLPEDDEDDESSGVYSTYDPAQYVDPAFLPSRSSPSPPDGWNEYEVRRSPRNEGQNVLELEGVLEAVTGLPPATDIEEAAEYE